MAPALRHRRMMMFLRAPLRSPGKEIPVNSTEYVQPQRAFEKMKYARALSETVYIGAATGYGKTELVSRYLQNRNYVSVSCESDWTVPSVQGEIDQMRSRSSAASIVVFFDDLQMLRDGYRKSYVLSLAKAEGIWLILAGRSALPDWLSVLYFGGNLTRIEERDLALDEKGVGRLLHSEAEGISMEEDFIRKACRSSEGMPMMVHFLARALKETVPASGGAAVLTDRLREECGKMFRNYLNTSVIPHFDAEVAEFCMQVSVVDEFDASLAEYITGEARTTEMVRRFRQLSCGMLEPDHGCYRFRTSMLRAFRERRDHFYDSRKVRELYYNAGLYFETHGKIVEAARMYEKSGSERIRNLLVLNGKLNPSSGFYYELKDYYMALREENIRRNVYLMSGMSMFCSLMLDPYRSEFWYNELKKYRDRSAGGEKKAADIQLLFLDIALPQRGIGNLVEIFQKMPQMVFSRGLELPEFSVTSNLPSMMDGGKDFSEWSRHDRVLASSIGRIVERALGRYGKGLVPLALAESQFEKAGDLTEIVSWISKGQMQAQNGGKIEMEFVAIGLLVRMNSMSGRYDDAISTLSAFREKAEEKGATHLLANIDALRCQIALLTGDVVTAERWMETSPDETRDFFIMWRLLYLTKVRCYIASGKYMSAASLAQKLIAYATRYHRTIVQIEADLLMAVIYYRQKNMPWKKYFAEALSLAADYRFVYTVCREGVAVLPLLEKIMKQPDMAGLRGIVPDEWLRKVLSETEKFARRYPSYLQGENARKTDFSQKDIDVLVFQAKGFSVSQIASALDMKPETVRYHIKQNYKKLQVSSKSEAVLAARDIGLL